MEDAEGRCERLAGALQECQDMVDCLQAFSHDQVGPCSYLAFEPAELA